MTDTLTPALAAIAAVIAQMVADASAAEMDAVLAASQEAVPVDTGALQQSGVRHEPVIAGTVVTTEITYGDENVDYALFVHEGHRTRSGSFVPPNQFLLTPLLAAQDGMLERIGARAQAQAAGEVG